MARAGLGDKWKCLFANDFDKKKADVYKDNWGQDEILVDDVWHIPLDLLRGTADLAWASFPCQDLSLAGTQAGLEGKRSGAFWGFWKHMLALSREGRQPSLVVLENVYGTLTSNQGRDFVALLDALRAGGYNAGALVIDAVHFVPQSRPRLFIIAVRQDLVVPSRLTMDGPYPLWTPSALSAVLKAANFTDRKDWISWNLGHPQVRQTVFADLIDDNPEGVSWHSPAETLRLLAMMTVNNREKVRTAQLSGIKVVGTVYKRTRPGKDGIRSQRAEIRFDDIAGCLRTPSGGSSRQSIMIVEGKNIRSRLLAPREAARLMGLPEEYRLPLNYNDAYHLAGDGVVVPVVRHLAEYLLEPILRAQVRESVGAA